MARYCATLLRVTCSACVWPMRSAMFTSLRMMASPFFSVLPWCEYHRSIRATSGRRSASFSTHSLLCCIVTAQRSYCCASDFVWEVLRTHLTSRPCGRISTQYCPVSSLVILITSPMFQCFLHIHKVSHTYLKIHHPKKSARSRSRL